MALTASRLVGHTGRIAISVGFRLHQGGSERFDFCGATFDRCTDRDMIHTNRRPIPNSPLRLARV